jgi:hypothetical protein
MTIIIKLDERIADIDRELSIMEKDIEAKRKEKADLEYAKETIIKHSLDESDPAVCKAVDSKKTSDPSIDDLADFIEDYETPIALYYFINEVSSKTNCAITQDDMKAALRRRGGVTVARKVTMWEGQPAIGRYVIFRDTRQALWDIVNVVGTSVPIARSVLQLIAQDYGFKDLQHLSRSIRNYGLNLFSDHRSNITLESAWKWDTDLATIAVAESTLGLTTSMIAEKIAGKVPLYVQYAKNDLVESLEDGSKFTYKVINGRIKLV